MKYKVLVCDLDHTLLNDDRNISEENEVAIKKAIKEDVHFILCSGRPMIAADRYLNQLDLKQPGNYYVGHNGSYIAKANTGECIYEKRISLEHVRKLLKYVEDKNISIQITVGDTIYVDKITERVEFERVELNTNIAKVNKLIEDINFDIHKLTLFGEHEELKTLKNEIEAELINDINVFFSNPAFIELSHCGASKGFAIEYLAEKLGCSMDEIICVGDNFNDLSMLEMCGLGIAVANACDEIKDKVKYITKSTNNEGAIKEVIEKFIIIPKL